AKTELAGCGEWPARVCMCCGTCAETSSGFISRWIGATWEQSQALGEGARLTGVIRNWFRPAPTRLFVMACARSGRRSLSAALAATHSSRNSPDTVGAEFKTTELT